jgi:predicted phage baseplate assembly protein
MPLPEPILDDLRFQKDLVDEARRRIIRYCPEWTDYNLSDPGITLIELFAWMTEMLIYRLNRVPEKNYIKFMEMLGIQLEPASSARTDLTFWLSTPFPIAPEDDTVAVIAKGTEVATRRTEEEEEIIFTTDQPLTIRAPKLSQLRRTEDFHKNYLPRLGIEIFYPFTRNNPQIGETFYFGFDETENIRGHILRLTFDCERTQAVGVRREDPPLVWECSLGNGLWQEVPLSTRPGERDTTGGLNNAAGSLVLYLPPSFNPDQVYGRNAYWIRCRLEQRRPEQGMYTESPRIINVEAHSIGATTPATHAIIVYEEILGRSNGTPGQMFYLEHTPVLALQEGETIEVEEKRDGEIVFVPWQRVDHFAYSTRYDRHFTLDTATGQLSFGPAIRHRDGLVRQYGRVPEAGRTIHFSHYRYGGGVVGNVPAERIQVLKSSIAYIDRVMNLRSAAGGRDQESLEEAKMRARQEIRSQDRAVTGQDFENLTKAATRVVARVKCNMPGQRNGSLPPGMLELLIVPSVLDSLESGDLSKLQLDETLRDRIRNHLDQYRLLTTTLRIREPSYLGVKVKAEIVPNEFSRPEIVRARVIEALTNFISPLVDRNKYLDESIDTDWEGWPYGRDLYVAEISSLIQRVPGVKHVIDVQLSQRKVTPGQEALARAGEEAGETTAPQALVDKKMIKVAPDTLLVSLDHEIEVVSLDE